MKIGVTTTRDNPRHFSLSMVYDHEDCFVEAAGAQLIRIPPAPKRHPLERRASNFFGISRGRTPVPEIERGLDVLISIICWPGQLDLGHIRNLRRNVGLLVLYVYDVYPRHASFALLDDPVFAEADLIISSFSGSEPALRELFGDKVMVLPQAVNPRRFKYKKHPRPVFCAAMGRQNESFFESLRVYAKSHDKYFVYQDDVGRYRRSWQHSYDYYAETLRNSKYIFNWSQFSSEHMWEETRGLDPVTGRWFEAAAAGGLIVGVAPTSSDFGWYFGSDDYFDVSAFDYNVDELFGELEKLSNDEIIYRTAELSQRIRQNHTWFHRYNSLAARLGLPAYDIEGIVGM